MPAGLKENVPHQKRQHFHFDLWFCLTLQNWVLDFGRPIVMVSWLSKLVMNAYGAKLIQRINESHFVDQ